MGWPAVAGDGRARQAKALMLVGRISPGLDLSSGACLVPEATSGGVESGELGRMGQLVLGHFQRGLREPGPEWRRLIPDTSGTSNMGWPALVLRNRVGQYESPAFF